MIRIATLVAATIVAFPVATQAQSPGWVLWDKTTESEARAGSPATNTGEWYEPLNGYESAAECRDDIRRRIADLEVTLPAFLKAMKINAEVIVSIDRRSISMLYPTDAAGVAKGRQRSFVCFPGTLDPRPRSN